MPLIVLQTFVLLLFPVPLNPPIPQSTNPFFHHCTIPCLCHEGRPAGQSRFAKLAFRAGRPPLLARISHGWTRAGCELARPLLRRSFRDFAFPAKSNCSCLPNHLDTGRFALGGAQQTVALKASSTCL